jgi:hypothetical protein
MTQTRGMPRQEGFGSYGVITQLSGTYWYTTTTVVADTDTHEAMIATSTAGLHTCQLSIHSFGEVTQECQALSRGMVELGDVGEVGLDTCPLMIR